MVTRKQETVLLVKELGFAGKTRPALLVNIFHSFTSKTVSSFLVTSRRGGAEADEFHCIGWLGQYLYGGEGLFIGLVLHTPPAIYGVEKRVLVRTSR